MAFQSVMAQSGDAEDTASEDAGKKVEEVVVLGTRSNKPRSVTDSTVPVDVISADDMNASGNTADLTDSP